MTLAVLRQGEGVGVRCFIRHRGRLGAIGERGVTVPWYLAGGFYCCLRFRVV